MHPAKAIIRFGIVDFVQGFGDAAIITGIVDLAGDGEGWKLITREVSLEG